MNQAGQVIKHDVKNRLIVGCLSLLIGVPMMACCLIVLFTVVLPQVETLSASTQNNYFPLIALVFGVLLIFGMILVPVIVMFFVIRKRAALLDSVFVPLGLQGKMYLLVGRHYWGTIAGRPVEIYFYRGPTLEIRLGAHSQTNAQILPKTTIPVKISAVFQKVPIVFPNPQLNEFAIYAEDEPWVRQLLADLNLVPVINSLLYGQADWAIFRHLEISPTQVSLLFYRSKKFLVSENQFSALQVWLNDLSAIANRIEAIPAPAKVYQPQQYMTREVRLKRSKVQFYIIIGLLIFLPLCLILIGVITFLLVS